MSFRRCRKRSFIVFMIFSIDSSTLLPKRAALGKVHPDRSGALRELHTPPPVTPDAASRPISATPARIDGTNRCCWAEQGRRSEIGNHGSDVGSRWPEVRSQW